MADSLICGEPWLCRNHHILGLSQRIDVKEGERKWKVDVLHKLRQSLDIDTDCLVEMAVPETDVDCRVEGTVHDIRCSVCGEKRTWWVGKQALNRLLAKQNVQCLLD